MVKRLTNIQLQAYRQKKYHVFLESLDFSKSCVYSVSDISLIASAMFMTTKYESCLAFCSEALSSGSVNSSIVEIFIKSAYKAKSGVSLSPYLPLIQDHIFDDNLLTVCSRSLSESGCVEDSINLLKSRCSATNKCDPAIYLLYAKDLVRLCRFSDAKKILQQHQDVLINSPYAIDFLRLTRMLKMNDLYSSSLRFLNKCKRNNRTLLIENIKSNSPSLAHNAANFLKNQLDNDSNVSNDHKVLFALGRYEERLGNLDLAYKYLCKANQLKDNELKFSIVQTLKEISAMKALNNELICNCGVSYKLSFTPIFVVGVPRSGTSIVSATLSQDQSIFNSGEHAFLRLAIKHGLQERYHCKVCAMRKAYEQYMKQFSLNHKHIIDKTPLNFLLAPLIFKLFPESIFINCKRSHLSLAWSNFKHSFNGSGNAFLYNLNTLANFIQLHSHLIKEIETHHFANSLNVSLDRLQESPSDIFEQVFCFLGLNWNEEYLTNGPLNSIVMTASNDQILISPKDYSSNQRLVPPAVFETDIQQLF